MKTIREIEWESFGGMYLQTTDKPVEKKIDVFALEQEFFGIENPREVGKKCIEGYQKRKSSGIDVFALEQEFFGIENPEKTYNRIFG